MKRNYSGVWKGFAIVFAAVIYSILLFAFKKNFNLASWIAYGYTMVAFFVLLAGVCFQSGSEKAYPMFDLAASGLSCIYFCVQFILGGIAAMAIPDLSTKTAGLVGLLLLSVYVVIVLVFRAGTSSVQGQDDIDGRKVMDQQLLVAEIDTIETFVAETQLREKLSTLRDLLRYSDPLGQTALADLEERIRHNITLLREEAEEGENEKISVRIDRLQRLLAERNQKCRALKK